MFSGQNILYPKRALKSGSAITAQSLAVSTAAVTPTGYTDASSGSNPVQLVAFDVQTNDVRVRWDGVAPTASVGTILYAGTNYTWNVDQYNNCQFIQSNTASGSATVFAHPMSP